MRRLALLAFVASLAVAAPADAAELLSDTVTAPAAESRVCHERLATGSSVVRKTVALGSASLVRARLNGSRGDWDLGVFDAASGRSIGGSAAFGTAELAETFHNAPVIVQACRRSGESGSPRLQVAAFALPTPSGDRSVSKLIKVQTPTPAEEQKLQSLGLDLTEHGDAGTLEVVTHGAADEEKLRASGLQFSVVTPDLLARELENKRADLAYSLATPRSGMPSGRTEYRRLADFEAEMKGLAEQHPNLVKPLVLPNRSLEGRQVQGIEITENVNAEDGKPVFVQLGVHHAREWPSGEMPMEFANDLVKGFGSDDRTTRLVKQVRTIVVPIVNVDGYNLSREASVDLRVTGTADPLLQPFTEGTLIDAELNNSPGHLVAVLADGQTGQFAYKRRNCRIADGATPGEGECGSRENRTLGVDPNRNYGGFWGGPGASHDPGVDTYRGAAPFSEPETQNVKALVSGRQVTTLITNHTYSDLVLRPPGLRAQGPPPDEPVYKALGDEMAAQNGYVSQKSYELYDTTGTTEDWSYYATGGLGFTFEIGNKEFHPPYADVVSEYTGKGAFAGRGNREAYFIALEHTADKARHSLLTGRAKPGTKLQLSKAFTTFTSPVLADSNDEETAGSAIGFADQLKTTMTVPASGVVDWHINPSTRPAVRGSFIPNIAAAPSKTDEIPFTPTVPGTGARNPATTIEHPFTVSEADAREAVKIRVSWESADNDFDLEILRKSGERVQEVGKSASAGGSGTEEEVVLPNVPPGEYVARIINWAAVDPQFTGAIEFFAPGPNALAPKTTEAWDLTCPDGRTSKVSVERGGRVNAGDLCASGESAAVSTGPVILNATTRSRRRTGLTIAFDRARLRTALRRGLRARGRCTATCRVQVSLKVDRRTARRLKLRSTTVARASLKRLGTTTRAFRVRFTRDARSKLRRSGRVRLSAVATARDTAGGRAAARRGMTLRR
jgi:Zinc carboxypeptidase